MFWSTEAPLQASAAVDITQQNDSTKIWNEEQGSLISFDDNGPVARKESEVSLLSTSIKEIEEKTQEVLNLQQELNDVNASLKEEKWYSAALKEEVDKITKEKNEFQQKCKEQKKEKQEMEENFNKKLMEEKEKNVKCCHLPDFVAYSPEQSTEAPLQASAAVDITQQNDST
ncbi:hypothetical protein AC249_AIPGENE24358, partial [Exaiptasia diaphana]